jgi:hypothetical protein
LYLSGLTDVKSFSLLELFFSVIPRSGTKHVQLESRLSF